MKISGITYSPKISNSRLLLWASQEGVALDQLTNILKDFNYEIARRLFVFCVVADGGNLTVDEVDSEVDKRMDAFTELMVYVANQLNPSSGAGESTPTKVGRKTKL